MHTNEAMYASFIKTFGLRHIGGKNRQKGSKICDKGKWIFLFFIILHNEMTTEKLDWD